MLLSALIRRNLSNVLVDVAFNPPSFCPRPWYMVFALTGVCEGNGQSVGVAEAFAERRYNGLSEAVFSAFVHSTHPPEQDDIPQ
jgi:hypothetical protein